MSHERCLCSVNRPCRVTKLDTRLDGAATPSGSQLTALVPALSLPKLFGEQNVARSKIYISCSS